MIKKWEEFSLIKEDNNQVRSDEQQAYLDGLSKIKDKYFLISLISGTQEDAEQLSDQLCDFRGFEGWDIMRNKTPITMYYLYEFTIKKMTPMNFKKSVMEEAENLGLKVKVLTHNISEYDWELEDDLPRGLRIDIPKAVKSLNTG